MKKILFVIFTEDFSWGTAILASLAQRHGWSADILFLPRNGTVNIFINHLESFRPDILAISFMSYDRRLAFNIAQVAKEMGLCTIGGGVHPTFLPEDVISTGLFQAIVVGDGMGVLEELLDQYSHIATGNGCVIQGKRHPDRSLYTNLFYSDSQIKRMKRTRCAMLLSSQGCPFKCRFCGSGALEYLAYSPNEIVHILDYLHTNFGVNNFQFFDDLFAQNAQRCRSIHQEVLRHFGKEANIHYGNFVQARASTFNESIAEELVSMGIDCVNFGIETASPKLLKFLNKKQTTENCYDAMRICKEYNLVRKVNLMFGIPTQDEEDYKITLNFVAETKPEIKTCFFYVPMPGSDLYDYCFNYGYLPAHYNRNQFDWFHDQPDGFVEIQCRLQSIDYEMALSYKNLIEKTGSHIASLFERVQIVDQVPWVIVGTSKTYYFKKFVEKLSSITHNKCLGYLDLEHGGGFSVDPNLRIQSHKKHNSKKPLLCVTYCYLGGEDYEFICRAAKDHFGEIPVISMASYRYHKLNQIKRMIQITRKRSGSMQNESGDDRPAN